MSTYFDRWMEQEEAWAAEIAAKRRKKDWISAAIAFIACVAAVSGIGFLGAGIEAALSNIKYGVILGLISAGIFLIVMLCGDYKKIYLKALKKEVKKELTSEALKEEFAMAMLDRADGRSHCLEYAWQKGAAPERFCVAGDFAVLRGLPTCIVQLKKTDKIELDVVDVSSVSNVGDFKVRVTNAAYSAYFYYQKPGAADKKKQKVDKMIPFPSKNLREQAIQMIKVRLDRSEAVDSH